MKWNLDRTVGANVALTHFRGLVESDSVAELHVRDIVSDELPMFATTLLYRALDEFCGQCLAANHSIGVLLSGALLPDFTFAKATVHQGLTWHALYRHDHLPRLDSLFNKGGFDALSARFGSNHEIDRPSVVFPFTTHACGAASLGASRLTLRHTISQL